MANELRDNQVHTIGSQDSDTAPKLMPADRVAYLLNLRSNQSGQKGVGINIMGTTLIPNSMLPEGNNLGIGHAKDEKNNKLYLFNFNDQALHGIYVLDYLSRIITPVILNLTDTNSVDVLRFSPDNRITHANVVNGILYWVDGLNKARKANIAKCIDKTTTGYAGIVTEDLITVYKATGVYAPKAVYFTDLTRTSNYVYGLQFKFIYRLHYADFEISNWSDFGNVPLPPNESFLGTDSISFNNNRIDVTVETGSRDVTKIEIGVKIIDATGEVSGGFDWAGCAILNKKQLSIGDNTVYTYQFYNDGSYWVLDQELISRPYNFIPRIPQTQEFLNVSMAYGNEEEGFEDVPIVAKVDVTFQPFYLPDGTVSQLNHPVFTAQMFNPPSSHGGVFNTWWTTNTQFEIGEDVKKGNTYIIQNNQNGSSFTYVATLTDSAITVANAIKNFLRLVDAVGTGSFANEHTDGDGNVLWDFVIEAHEGQPPITFTTSVAPVNYSTLLDNGLSVNCIKQGDTRKYSVVYEDDDQKTTLSYTCDGLSVRTPFETETLLGQSQPIGLQQAIHTISLQSQPPIWAKKWRLMRTPDLVDFIQMLIQQVITVTVANEATYLDLVVGSLFTYQKIHPETVLKYEFVRGDRVRIISNLSALPDGPPLPYTPYFETEVLNYSIDTEEFVNDTIITDGTNAVAPGKGVKADYVGKNIMINGIERTITGISGSKYVLDADINGDGFGTPFIALTFPNYTFIDRRGILRIVKPPASYNVVDLSKVEVYHPKKNSNDEGFQDFNDFQMKFDIANWGTDTRAHMGNIQNQDGTSAGSLISTPAIIQVTQGDVYVRNRALPTSNDSDNPQVVIDKICDPNYSDFYQSNFYNLGRVYPQDQGQGVVKFPGRIRFSTSYIQDTQINGLNDFNSQDRVDYVDSFGAIVLLRFIGDYLFVFKQLKTAWTPVNKKIIVDNAGNETLATSDKLLNDLRYAIWDGGIGNNGLGWVQEGDYQYIPSPNSGVFLRIANDGSIPISSLYSFDKKARDILAFVNKYNLNLYGGVDRENGEVIWSLQPFTPYIFDNDFNAGDWQTITNAFPDGTTWAITQQPVNSTATIVDDNIEITDTNTLGNDVFKYQGTLPDNTKTPVFNFCFTVVEPVNRKISYIVDPSTIYCRHILGPGISGENNDGNQSYKVLKEIYIDDQSLAGNKMPNIQNISPEAVVDNSSNITYNQFENVTPTGGTNNDIWYNEPADMLYKNILGSWFLLTDRVLNTYYQAPILNTIDCQIPFYSAQKSGVATKDDCTGSTQGTDVTYIVPAGKYTSLTSQIDADNMAQADVDANKQSNADSQGICLPAAILNNHLVEQGAPDPFIDINSQIKVDGNDVSDLFTNGDDLNIPAKPGSILEFTAYTFVTSTAIDPLMYLVVTKNGIQVFKDNTPVVDGNLVRYTTVAESGAVYDASIYSTNVNSFTNARQSEIFTKSTCGSGMSGTAVEYVVSAGVYTSTVSQADADSQATADIAANGQANADTNGDCVETSNVGTLLVDYFEDTGVDACFYCSTPGTDELNQIVASSANGGPLQLPNDGRDPSGCYIVSSDKLSGPPTRRFGANLIYFVLKYPAINIFTFDIDGRSDMAQVVSGNYAKRDSGEGYLIMSLYTDGVSIIPGVSGATTADIENYSTNVISGANGAVGVGVGAKILRLTYNVSANTITATTF